MRGLRLHLALLASFAASAAGAGDEAPLRPADHLPAEAVAIIERAASNLQLSCLQGVAADCDASRGLFQASHIIADRIRACLPPEADPEACQAAEQLLWHLGLHIAAMGPRVRAETDEDGAPIPLTVRLNGPPPEAPPGLLRQIPDYDDPNGFMRAIQSMN